MNQLIKKAWMLQYNLERKYFRYVFIHKKGRKKEGKKGILHYLALFLLYIITIYSIFMYYPFFSEAVIISSLFAVYFTLIFFF